MHSDSSTDITRIVLFVLVIGVLLAGSVWTLLPFLSGMIWATTIAVATWPVLLRLERLTGGRRWLFAPGCSIPPQTHEPTLAALRDEVERTPALKGRS